MTKIIHASKYNALRVRYHKTVQNQPVFGSLECRWNYVVVNSRCMFACACTNDLGIYCRLNV